MAIGAAGAARHNVNLNTPSIPGPGSIFIIRSVSCGRVLTLYEGQPILASQGGLGSIHWVCEENDGWLAFRNLASDRYLGHNGSVQLQCSQIDPGRGQDFCIRQVQEGSYVLLLADRNTINLWRLGLVTEKGVERLAQVGSNVSSVVYWEFIEV